MPKDKNTFKYKNFEELLPNEISIKNTSKLDVDSESYLKECFEKWNTINASSDFVELRKELGPKIMTLGLLLNNVDKVIEILFQHLEKGSKLSVYTVLDMIQSLVCDIRGDILPHLPRVFAIINGLMETLKNEADDAELISCSFRCIAHIIFYLERDLIKDGKIIELLPLVQPLLFHPRKPFIRKFMAQCLAFLVRRVKHFSTFFNTVILDQVVTGHSTNHSDAIGKLMSSCLRTKVELLPSARAHLLVFLEILYAHSDRDDVVFLIACFDEMFKDLLATIDERSYSQVWQILIEKISSSTDEAQPPQELELLTMELFFKSAQHKKLQFCSKIVVQKVKSLVCASASDKVIEIAKVLIDKLPVSQELVDVMRAIILSKDMDMCKKFEFIKSYLFNDHYEMTMKNSMSDYLSSFITRPWLEMSSTHIETLLTCMSDLIITKYPINRHSHWKELLANNNVNYNFFFLKNDDSVLIESMLAIVTNNSHDSIIMDDNSQLLWMTMIVLPHLYPANTDHRFEPVLRKKMDILMRITEPCASTLIDMSCLLECMARLADIRQDTHKLPLSINTDHILSLLPNYDFCSPMEPIVLEILSKSLSIDANLAASHIQWQSIFIDKLKSPSHQSRLSSLEILVALCPYKHHDYDTITFCRQMEELLELKETELVKKEKTLYRLMDHMRYTTNMTDMAKQIIISYLLGALHVHYTSLWKYIIKTLSTFYPNKKETMKTNRKICENNEGILWKIISSQLDYCAIQVAKEAKDTSLTTEYCSVAQEQYIRDKFYSGRDVDWLTYRLNLIKTMVEFPELAGKKTAVLSPLLLSVYCDEVRAGHKGQMKTRKDTLMSLLYLYSRIPNIMCTFSENNCRQLYYKCLSSKQPELQKAALLVLVNYKMPEVMTYKEKMILAVEKGQEDVRDMSLQQVIASHRKVVVPIMIRIIVGKLKKCGIVKKQKPLIGYLLDLEDNEMDTLLLVLMEAVKQTTHEYETVDMEGEKIESISSEVKELVSNNQCPQGLFRTMNGVCATINGVLVGLVNKMSYQVLTSILTVVLDFYDCCTMARERRQIDREMEDQEEQKIDQEDINDQKMDQEDMNDQEMDQEDINDQKMDQEDINDQKMDQDDINDQKMDQDDINDQEEARTEDESNAAPMKHLRQQCASIVLYFFTKIEDYPWTEASLERVTQSIIAPQLVRLVDENVSSVNTTILLAVIWSDNDQWIHLITPHLFSSLVTLLTKTRLNRDVVASKLVHIVYNIMTRLTTDIRCKTMVLDNLGPLIGYLSKRVTAMRPYGRMKAKEDHKVLSQELAMVTMCVDLLIETQWNDDNTTIIKDMINNVLIVLYKSNPVSLFVTATDEDNDNTNKENIEVNFLRALEAMMCACGEDIVISYLERLLTLFGRLRRRASRSVLSAAVAKILTNVHMPVYGGDGEGDLRLSLGEVVVKLNSWDISHLEDMDYISIMNTLDQVKECLKLHSVTDCMSVAPLYNGTTMHPSLWLYHVTAQNCLYLMAQVSESGPRDNAAVYLRQFMASMASTNDDKIIRALFFDHMWPFIANLLCSKDQMCHLAFVSLLHTVLTCLGQSARFVDIARLAHTETEEAGFFEGMLSLSDNDQTKALRKLTKFLGRHQVAEHNLREIIRPMIYYRLMSVEAHASKTEKQRTTIKVLKNEYTIACLESMTAMTRQCPPVMYKKMVDEQMVKIDKGTDVESSIRVLISILDGYKETGSYGAGDDNHDNMVQVLRRLETHLARKDPKADKHKKAQKSSNDDALLDNKKDAEWTMRGVCLQVPIALAIVNIAVKLPKKQMREQVTRVILSLVGFLKSDDAVVRKTSVDTMIEILLRLNTDVVVGGGGDQKKKKDEKKDQKKDEKKDEMKDEMKDEKKDEKKDEMKDEKKDEMKDEKKDEKKDEMMMDTVNVSAGRKEVKFLNFAVNSIKSQLSRGFQRHVGLFACHSIMTRLTVKKMFEIYSLELPTMTSLIDMYLDEQFGEMAKEKIERHDAEKGMIREAATDKAYEGLRGVSQIISKSHLLEFVRRLTEAAKEMTSQKSLNKMCTILESIKTGLLNNSRLDAVCLFTLALVYINDNLASICTTSRITTTYKNNDNRKNAMQVKHFYQAPSRLDGRTEVKADTRVNMADNYSFLVINFGLNLFNLLIKTHKCKTDLDLRSILEPVVDRVIMILSQVTHHKTMTAAVKCLSHIIHLSPPRLDARAKDLTELLFKLLKTNSSFRDKNDLSSVVFFKSMTLFLQRSDVVLSPDQYNMLLLGIEIDSYNHRQTMNSIYLLRTIISRRIKEPVVGHSNILIAKELDVQIVDIVDRIRPIAMAADSDKTRQEARSSIISYMRLYKRQDGGTYVATTMMYFLKNMVSATESGQISAALIIQAIMNEHGSVIVDDDEIKMTMIGSLVLSMQRGVSEGVERVLLALVTQLMSVLDEAGRGKIYDLVMGSIVHSDVSSIYLGISMLMMATMTSVDTHNETRSKRFVETLCEKTRALIDSSDKMNEQIRAACGVDEELMIEMGEMGDEEVTSKQGLMDEKMVVVTNIDRVLVAIGRVLEIGSEGDGEMAMKRHVIRQGIVTGVWSLIIRRLIDSKYTSNVRVHAAKNVLQSLLRYELEYDEHMEEDDNDEAISMVVFDQENIFQLIEASFKQMNNKALSVEENDVLLVNLLYLWRLIASNYNGHTRVTLLQKLIDNANRAARDELMGKRTVHVRCTVLKLLAGIVAKSDEAVMNIVMMKNIIWIWSREHKQLKNDKNMKSDGLAEKDVNQWTELVETVGTVIKERFGDRFSEIMTELIDEKTALRRKRKIDAAALAVADPGQFIAAAKKRRVAKK